MINWAVIDKKEYASLEAYARLFGLTPDEFANAKLAALRSAESTFHRAQSGIGGRNLPQLQIHESLEPAAALIALGRRAAKGHVARLGALVSRHLVCYGRLYAINWNRLKNAARTAGVNPNERDWVGLFLQEIPIIQPFSPDINAFVHFFQRETPKIVVSANLHNVFEISLVPLILNVISEDGHVVPLVWRHLSTELVESAIAIIIATARAYMHENVRALDPYLNPASPSSWILKHTEIVDTLGACIVSACIDFVFLHEIAHVVFSHETDDPKRSEFEADNLALNCVIQDLRETGEGDDLLAGFGVIVMVFYCFQVIEALYRAYVSSTHQPALMRRAALSLTITGAFAKNGLEGHQVINEVMCGLFTGALAQLDEPPDSTGKSGLGGLKGFCLAVIPSEEAPYTYNFQRRLDPDDEV